MTAIKEILFQRDAGVLAVMVPDIDLHFSLLIIFSSSTMILARFLN